MNKATAIAHSNLAFVKYWGKIDHTLNLPSNSSISMNLSGAQTTTTVEFDDTFPADEVRIAGQPASAKSAARIAKHLDLIRATAGIDLHAHVATENNFPESAGIASSASGFAALTLAAAAALGLNFSERQLSILARRGSGSACRSIPSGFVEWIAGTDSETSYAASIAAPDHWNLVDIAVIVSTEAKSVSSSLGHKLAEHSDFWDARQAILPARLDRVRQAILDRDFHIFGREIEQEALSMHAVALTSAYEQEGRWNSGVYYLAPDTLELLIHVQRWRAEGLPVYFTLDAGPTVHLITTGSNQQAVIDAVKTAQSSRPWNLLISDPAPGAYLVSDSGAKG